jgi:tetratricopeptide (TPR) repeat protein
MQYFIKSFFLLAFLVCSMALSAQKTAVKELIEKKKYKEALQLVNKELAANPDDAELNFYKWEAGRSGGLEFKECFKYLNRAIALDGTYSEAYCDRGVSYLKMLRFDDAKDDIDAALKYARTDSLKRQALLVLASYYSDTRHHKEAVETNLKVLEYDSLNVPALNNLAMGYQDLGEMEKALSVLYRIEKLDPKAHYVVINIGFVLSKLDQYEKAIEYFNKAEKMDKDALVYSNRAYAKYKLKDYSGAMVDINKSIKLFPSNSYAYRVRGLIYLDQKNTDKACDDFAAALGLKYTEMYDDDVKQMRDKYCIK